VPTVGRLSILICDAGLLLHLSKLAEGAKQAGHKDILMYMFSHL
jgi:hypothetical protein